MSSTSVLFGLFGTNNDADQMAQAAKEAAMQQTAQIGIMGMQMTNQAQIRSDDMKYSIDAQKMMMQMQIDAADRADARQASNDARALRNDMKQATLMYSNQLTQISDAHEEKMKQIENQKLEIDYKTQALAKQQTPVDLSPLYA